MIRIVTIAIVVILILLVVRVIRLIINFSSQNKSSIDDLKERASNLKKKYGDVEEVEFKEIPPKMEDEETK